MVAPSCPFLFSRLDVTTINKCRTTELRCSDFTSGIQRLLCRRVLWPLSVRCVCAGGGEGLAEVGGCTEKGVILRMTGKWVCP